MVGVAGADNELTSDRGPSSRADRIASALRARFAPCLLRVEDESHLHAGHAGASPEGETHYRVEIVAPAFRSMSRLERHRAVNAEAAAEFETGLHALAISAKAPGE